MRFHIEIAADGRVLGNGFSAVTDDEPLPQGAVQRVFLDDMPPDLRTHYWDDAQRQSLGERPSYGHRFCHVAKRRGFRVWRRRCGLYVPGATRCWQPATGSRFARMTKVCRFRRSGWPTARRCATCRRHAIR